MLSQIPDWSTLIAFPEKLTPSIGRAEKRRSKKFASFYTWEIEAVTAAPVQCPYQQIKEPYSSFLLFFHSFFILLLSYLPLFFQTTYNYLLHNGAMYQEEEKVLCHRGYCLVRALYGTHVKKLLWVESTLESVFLISLSNYWVI